MEESDLLKKARGILADVRDRTLSIEQRSAAAIDLASLMLSEATLTESPEERDHQAQLARMMKDPQGKLFTTKSTDQCFRSSNPARVADQIIYLLEKYGIPSYLDFSKKIQLMAFKFLGNKIPGLLVPLVKNAIRKETHHVILPGDHDKLFEHLRQRRTEGVRVNLNHLGEAILGEEEALQRLQVYLDDLSKPEIEYISVKISTIYSQLNLMAWDDTLKILEERLKSLYRAAMNHEFVRQDGSRTQKFVNLDMEEYRDLRLTVDLFKRTLDDPEFFRHSAGIVLQSYLPDSFLIQRDLTSWAMGRVSKGGAPIKIRIVKGANLAMERVDASLHGWPQAPYESKAEVDANFKRMVMYGCHPEHVRAAYLGIGSHNLLDIAYAMLLREELSIQKYVCFEMLEGMADNIRRVVQKLTQDMLLYCPAAKREDFQNAVAYLIRRLDENTAPENFLRHAFDMAPGTKEWQLQTDLFKEACLASQSVSFNPRRTQNRFIVLIKPGILSPFENEPDTDWAMSHNRRWAEEVIRKASEKKALEIPLAINGDLIHQTSQKGIGEDPSFPGQKLYQYALAEESHIETALSSAQKAFAKWSQTSTEERSILLAEAAHALRTHRADLIAAMAADTGKIVSEADTEVSEAIDFAEYYRRNLIDLSAMEDITWRPKGTVLVAPPWNFPCSIPAGGIFAALAAGNCVIFKPAPEAVMVGWELVQLIWKAGIDKRVLQFIACEDDPIGTRLIKDPRIAAVVLTGAASTAKNFLKMRPGINLMAEAGGKNAIVITDTCDRDLAIKDLIQSAFGHSGQKCSACSLAICEERVYDDPAFRANLRDAAASLHVGSPWDLATRVSPLIRPPNPILHRALTTLDEGEEWLLEPKQDPANPQLWSPGIKLGVKPGSFMHLNELFGPVLGMMRAKDLNEAIEFANGTPYGLTAGIHALDEREQQYWMEHIEAGNCYVNRGITGAIVQRQPFGGCKDSSFGPGAKAGGPNYLQQLMDAQQAFLPRLGVPPSALAEELTEIFEESNPSKEEMDEWIASIGSYHFFWGHYFSIEHDPSNVLGEDNILKYLPQHHVMLRIQPWDRLIDVLRVMVAADICGTELYISYDSQKCPQNIVKSRWQQEWEPNLVEDETEEAFIEMLHRGTIQRVRLLSQPTPELESALAQNACTVLRRAVLANGRLELLNYLREACFSIDYHRYGYLGEREPVEEEKLPKKIIKPLSS